jgi:hypothetical protein
LSDPRWTNLGENIALKPGQVLLYTNIGNTPNRVDTSGTSLAVTVKRSLLITQALYQWELTHL